MTLALDSAVPPSGRTGPPGRRAAEPPTLPMPAVIASLVVGVAANQAVEHGPGTVSGTLAMTAAGLAMAVVPRSGRTSARLLGIAVVLLALGLMTRTSPWVAAPNLLVGCGTLVLVAVLHRGATLSDLTLPRLVVRSLSTLVDALRLPRAAGSWLAALRDRLISGEQRRRRITAYVRGLVLAAAAALLVVPLLAAGDAVFASLVDVDLSLGPFAGDVVVIAVVAAATGALLFAASRRGSEPHLPSGPSLGAPECLVPLGTLVVVFAAFAGSQVVASAGGAERVLETAGLTYAEYARTGFFQLLAAATVTLGVLLGLAGLSRNLDERSTRWVRAMSTTVVVLTLVCVGTAVQRLALYEDAFGLTMLRLYALVAAGWIALILLLAGAAGLGVGRGRSWLPGAMIGSALSVLLLLTALNPEAVVVRRNVARAADGGAFDPAYLAGLSDDAVPTIVATLPQLSDQDQAALVTLVCAADLVERPARAGWSWNLSARRAATALRRIC